MVVVALLAGLVIGAVATSLVAGDDPAGGSDAAADAVSYEASADGAGSVRRPDSPAGAASAVPDPGPVTLAFVGDINAERSLSTRLAEDPAGFVGPFADVLRGADLAVGNLEAAVTTGGSPLEKAFTFRAPPGILDALRAGGIDVVSAANNHGMDFGTAGLQGTVGVKRARADGMLIGVGADEEEAYSPHLARVGGQRVAVIAATQVIDSDLIRTWTATDDRGGLASAKRVGRLVEAVRAARSDADTVVVYLHWGVEAEVCPSTSQRELAGALVEAGADVIVGGHAHRVQGAGRLGGAFVGYGMGNFLFGAFSEAGAETGVLLVEVDGRDVLGYEWRPGRIVGRVPQPLTGAPAAAAIEEWNGLRNCTGLEP